MPIYAYQCAACGLEIDIFQHYTDDTLQVCPECKQATLQKVYSPTPIHFKGEGWGGKDQYNSDKAGSCSINGEKFT